MRPRLLSAAVAAAAFAFPGCGGSAEQPTEPTNNSVVEFRAAPSEMVSACRQKAAVAARCPRELPAAGAWSWRFIERLDDRMTFTIQSGAEDRDSDRNRPPFFVHIVVDRGVLTDLDRLGAEAVRMNRLQRLPSETVSLGRRQWAGRTGELLLLPVYNSASSIHAGHLTFVQRRGRETIAFSIHAWLPAAESERVLRRVIESAGGS